MATQCKTYKTCETTLRLVVALCMGIGATPVSAFAREVTLPSVSRAPRPRPTAAAAATSERAEPPPPPPPPPPCLAYPLTQVVSDIDDTLKSSGGVAVAGVSLGGIDVQYDRGDFYPGVFQFMWELSSFPVTLNQRHFAEVRAGQAGSGDNLDLRLSPPKVAVLTARAEELKVPMV